MKFAMAKINGGEKYPKIRGKVLFEEKCNRVLITVHICNLPQTDSGFFGFHIHEGEDCSQKNFENTKGHYNPTNTTHPGHAGDMPPLLKSKERAYLSFETDRFKLRDIIGKTVVIHYLPDDFTTQPAGNAGDKIACGVINVLK